MENQIHRLPYHINGPNNIKEKHVIRGDRFTSQPE